MENNEFWDAMDAYKEAFGEYFPTDMFGGSEADAIALMQQAVATGIEYEPGIPDGCVA